MTSRLMIAFWDGHKCDSCGRIDVLLKPEKSEEGSSWALCPNCLTALEGCAPRNVAHLLELN